MATEVALSHNWSSDTWDWPIQKHDGVVKVINTNNKFEVGLGVGEFRPDEIKVSANGHDLVIHALHDVRNDQHGSIKRELNRVYKLPPDVNISSLKSHYDQHGTLLITADKQQTLGP